MENRYQFFCHLTKDSELTDELGTMIKSLIENHPVFEPTFLMHYGYAIFPKITKVGLDVVGVGGKGSV